MTDTAPPEKPRDADGTQPAFRLAHGVKRLAACFRKRQVSDSPSPDDARQNLVTRSFTISFSDKGIVRRYHLGNAPLLVGRSRSCRVRVYGKDVAPVHCRIERSSDGAIVLFAEEDGFPVLVNGSPVEFIGLNGGENICIGSTILNVRSGFDIGAGREEWEEKFSFENDFGTLFVRSIKKSHWLLVSCLIHFIAIYVISMLFPEEEIIEEPFGIVQNSLSEEAGEDPFDRDDFEDSGSAELDDPVEEPLDDPNDMLPSDPLSGKTTDFLNPYELGPNGFDGSGSDRWMGEKVRRALAKGSGNGLFGPGSGWGEKVGKLRGSGLDIAILFDSTGSMSRPIRKVKTAIGEMIRVLHRIVPNLQISLITFKGDMDASRYVIAGTPLVGDPFELLNFIRCVDISGGSSRGYAAIHTALHTAIHDLDWREEVQRVIILIGDAPPYPEEDNDGNSLIREFDGSTSTIYVNSGGNPRRGMNERAVKIFRQYAKTGGGEFIRNDQSDDVVRQIVTATVGSRYKSNVDAVFDSDERPRWLVLLDRKVKEHDVAWLMEKFLEQRTRPEAVDALALIGTEEVAARVWTVIRNGCDSPWLLHCSIYVLSCLTGLHLDYIDSSRSRLTARQLKQIRGVLTFKYGKSFLASLGKNGAEKQRER